MGRLILNSLGGEGWVQEADEADFVMLCFAMCLLCFAMFCYPRTSPIRGWCAEKDPRRYQVDFLQCASDHRRPKIKNNTPNAMNENFR